ncbi:MAG: YceI family protein [Pseudomonadota bacterium]
MRWFLIALLFVPSAARTEPASYALDRARSIVGFSVDMGGSPLKGNMNVRSAQITLDLEKLSQSTARITLDTQSAITEASFATEAMLGAQVLDANRFPTIRFEATRISGTLSGGTVEGLVTIRDVTRPITFSAQVFRQRGQAEGDTSRLSILLSGTIDRRDFGADGFPQFVGPQITLEVLTRLDRL